MKTDNKRTPKKLKNAHHANYTSENQLTTNPVTTQLTQVKTPRPIKILKNKSDINPKSGFISRIYAKWQKESKNHLLNPLESIKYYNPPNEVKKVFDFVDEKKSYFLFCEKID